MRAARYLLLAIAAACSPDIAPDTDYCGPNAMCPEDQVCSQATHRCVLSGLDAPFACEGELESEPDDTLETGYMLSNVTCTSPPRTIDACMPVDDPADWLLFTAPMDCATALQADVSITFPIAFQRMGFEIVDVASGNTMAMAGACASQIEGGSEQRCASTDVVPGATYGIRVAPTGEGTCDGECTFNSYTVRFHVGPPD